jgi:hypothetical protein
MGTHMGQSPANHVTLESTIVGNFITPTDLHLRKIAANGTVAPLNAPPFRIDPGLALVVTDVDWWYRSGTPGETQILNIDLQNLSARESHTVFNSAITLNNKGDGVTTEAMTSGFVVNEGGRILMSNFPGGGIIQRVIVRGYLCPNT